MESRKIKRVLKYIGVWLLSVIICAIVDGIIHIWFVDPWISFKHDWMTIYGAMAYRLVTTWNNPKESNGDQQG